MIYTIEYLNKDSKLSVVRYNQDDKSVMVVTPEKSSEGYVTPKATQIRFCIETEHQIIGSTESTMSHTLGYITAVHQTSGTNTAYEFIDMLLEAKGVPAFVEQVVGVFGVQPDKHSVH